MEQQDVLIVGAGFAGMYMLHRLRGLGLTAKVVEAGSGVGGTWYWNRYPGARCDVESMSYSYSFSDELQQEWVWPHRYAAQPDILRYANHVADRFDLRKDIVFDTRILTARFDEGGNRWLVDTDKGGRLRARYLVMATGCLSVPKIPDLPELQNFAGRVLHTASWPREGVDFSGKSVGIIGTGSSGVQSIPIIAQQARHLTVFQRTANFSIPAWNAPLPPEQEAAMKRNYGALREKSRNSYAGDYADEYYLSILKLTPEEREVQFEERWREGGFNFQYAFADLMLSEEANELAAEFVRRKIRATVRDPRAAEMLCPKDHPLGTKRLCVDTNYYETFNRENVSLVDIKSDPIVAMTPDGLRTRNAQYRFDILVLATGFDAMTGALTGIDIRGRNGISLKEQWRHGAEAYLGLAVAGFPNMFVVTGPGSPSVLANMILACEQHVEWIGDLLEHAKEQGIDRIEADPRAQSEWAREVTASADRTLYPKANSWYMGANVPGKPRVFMPYVDGFNVYSEVCGKIAATGYEGFRLTRAEPR
ncbi:MAG: flavin-containing monooxygenase [Pseudomonadota bacterium]